MSIISGFLNLTLPETLHQKLPETLEDLNRNEIVDASKYKRLLGEDGQGGEIVGEEDDDIEEFMRK